jgi:hypothetical protein
MREMKNMPTTSVLKSKKKKKKEPEILIIFITFQLLE